MQNTTNSFISDTETDSESDTTISKIELLLKSIEQGDSEKKYNTVGEIVACNSPLALELLLQKWADWISEDKEPFLVKQIVKIVRDQKLAVVPLLTLLSNLENRNLKVKTTIVRLLSEMSEHKFFEYEYKKYFEIKKELSYHALPILGQLLHNETNAQIIQLLTVTLSNIGGMMASHILADRARKDRQELLTKYYLEPSMAQSEQATRILQSTVKTAKITLMLQQGLSVITYGLGLGLLAWALNTSLKSENKAQSITAALAGIGGLSGVCVQFVNKPLDRIQNTMANLVQAETAFTSYIWELNLNSTFIQSQYMDNGILSNDQIENTVERIDNVTKMTMQLTKKNLEQIDKASNTPNES